MRDARYARRIGFFASRALLEEASLEQKPGLVCPSSSGAHHDMDFDLFKRSAHALDPYFSACALAGMHCSHNELHGLLPRLRPLGIEAESLMYRATGGINTHKGAIFSLGLASAAAGHVLASLEEDRNWRLDVSPDSLSTLIQNTMKTIAGDIASRELSTGLSTGLSAGVRQYRTYGVTGARGQAQAGYPLVFTHMLPFLLQKDGPQRHLDALLFSISRLDDTCLLSRGGADGLSFMQRRALEILHCGGAASVQGSALLARLCAEAARLRLSPGGSADMLALTIFLRSTIHFIQCLSRKEYSYETYQTACAGRND